MMDTDSYLLKCTLESIEEGMPLEKIAEECAHKMGFIEEESCNNEVSNPN